MRMDKYLARFRGVEPPRELRAKVLEAASRRILDTGRRRFCDGWLPGVAALVLILLIAVNAHLEDRVQALARGPVDVAPAKAGHDARAPVDSVRSHLRPRPAGRRTREVGEQSWLTLRADIARVVEG